MTMPLVVHADCITALPRIADGAVDLVVTSPPYDNLREYNGFSVDMPRVGVELFRVLKDGGIAAVVMQDQSVKYAKTLTTFRTAVDWCDNSGFRVFETIIYHRDGTPGAWWEKRFRVDHEYIILFLKGKKPAFFDKEPLKVPAKHAGVKVSCGWTRCTDGTLRPRRDGYTVNGTKCCGTIWSHKANGNRLKHKHPATFPDSLASDLIKCFCPPDGLVLDPFCGSGTTLVAAKKLGRRGIGIEISQEYCDLANTRLDDELKTQQDDLFTGE